MDDHNEMYEIGLTAPMEMAEEYRLDEMLPMMGLSLIHISEPTRH